MATTTSYNDQPSWRQRVTARLGVLAAAAALAVVGTISASDPAHASPSGQRCLGSGAATGCAGATEDAPLDATGAQPEGLPTGQQAASPLDSLLRGLQTGSLLNGLNLPLGGSGLPLGGSGGLPTDLSKALPSLGG